MDYYKVDNLLSPGQTWFQLYSGRVSADLAAFGNVVGKKGSSRTALGCCPQAMITDRKRRRENVSTVVMNSTGLMSAARRRCIASEACSRERYEWPALYWFTAAVPELRGKLSRKAGGSSAKQNCGFRGDSCFLCSKCFLSSLLGAFEGHFSRYELKFLHHLPGGCCRSVSALCLPAMLQALPRRRREDCESITWAMQVYAISELQSA